MGENNAAEINAVSRLALIITVVVFSIVLVILNILLKWEGWTIPLIIASLAAVLVTFVTDSIPHKMAIYLYSFILIAEVFYYTTNVQTTYDSTPVIVLMLVILGMTQDLRLLWGGYIFTIIGVLVRFFSASSDGFHRLDLTNIIRTEWHLVLMLIAAVTIQMLLSSIKRIERELNRRIAALEVQNNAAGDFLTNVSHEIRTPVNAVTGLTSLSIENETDEDKRARLLSVYDAGSRVAEQISDIMDYSEIDMGTLAVNEEDYMISSLVTDITESVMPHMKKDVEVIIDVDVSMPCVMRTDVSKLKKIIRHLITNAIKFTGRGGVYVKLDYDRQPYGLNLNISVTDTGIGMSDEQQRESFTRFYQGNSKRTRSSGGLGLGLPIVVGFLQTLGGFLCVDSTVGEGTTFRASIPQQIVDPGRCVYVDRPGEICAAAFLEYQNISMPQVRDFYDRAIVNLVEGLNIMVHRVDNFENMKRLEASLELTHVFVSQGAYLRHTKYFEELAERMTVAIVASEDVRDNTSRVKLLKKPVYCFPIVNLLNFGSTASDNEEKLYLPGVRALVVDDEIMNLTVAKSLFEKYGMTVATAGSGQEAINLCNSHDYDIVFMDHMMPEMDGVEAMKSIRAELKHRNMDMPFVALTANALSSAREMFAAEGFDGFVSKPVELSELERVLRKLLPKTVISHRRDDTDGQQTKDERRALFDGLKELGIDTKKGMHYSQDDKSFYEVLLSQFASEAAKKRKRAGKLLADDNMTEYAVIVHSIKSTARMIGASDLAAKAETMEKSAKAGRSKEVNAGHGRLMEDYSALSCGIAELLEGNSSKEEDGALELMPENVEVFEFLPKGESN